MKNKNLNFIFTLLLTLSCSLSFMSCGNKTVIDSSNIEESSYSNSTESSYDDILDDNVVNLKIQNDTFTELKHQSAKYINLEQYELKNLNIPVKGTISSINCLGSKIIVEIYPDDESDCVEIGVFDPYANTYETINRIPFCAAYGSYSCILQDRYFAMISSNGTDENLFGKVIVYDLESNELKSIDEYAVYNIVQFITPVGENGIAYFYYENETQDWIVKYYDISTNVSEEIFRHTNFNDLQMSPVAITSDGSDIALVIQYIQDDTYHTQLAWINSDGNLYKTEEIDLYNFFDTEDYEITDFKINNNYYLIKVLVQDEEEYFFFDRDNNSFHVILPAICSLNSLIGYSITNESDILFSQNVKVLGDLINVNLTDNSFCSYEFPYEFIENNTINCLKANANNDLIIFYGTDSSNYNYQMIQDYKSIETVPMNPGLYISPREQYERYANSDFATEEGIEDLKQTTETMEKEMRKDFRWRFVYQNYNY